MINQPVSHQGKDFYRPILWALLLAGSVFCAIGILIAGFRVDLTGIVTTTLIVFVAILLNLLRKRLQHKALQRFADTYEGFALFSAFAIVVCLASYPLAAVNFPLVDPMLAAADRAMGFSWHACFQFIESRPWLHELSVRSYRLIFFIPLILAFVLGPMGHGERLRRTIFAYVIMLIICLAMFIYFPAVDPVAYYGIDTSIYRPLTSHQEQVLLGIRAGEIRYIDTQQLVGMISFPSAHAALAVLFAWAAWVNRWLFAVIGTMSLMMFVATPIEGNHYMIDLVAGVVLAIVAIRLSAASFWRGLSMRLRRQAGSVAAPAEVAI